MQETTPGIRHWTAVHPNIGWTVSSYWLPDLKVLLDPLDVPDEVEGIEHIVMSNRHHTRSCAEASERFGATIHGPGGEPYEFGEPFIDGAITAYQVTELWPDDSALHIPSVDALAIADTVLRNDEGRLAWMPDSCFDDVAAERASIKAGLARLTDELNFSHLLLAHGDPIANSGREDLAAFAKGAG
jgi:hypothetical protein